MPTLVVGQSGGPTAAINASLGGVIAAAQAAGVERILGMRHGVEGLLAGELIDLTGQSASWLNRLRRTPAAILGSCRYKLQPGDSERILDRLATENARQFIYIGGNDSADTSHKVHETARAAGYELAVVGVPKTIDNDLPHTDHCPGYGSAARFVAQMTAEAALDTSAMRRTDPVKLIEVMGRHAGWLAAAAGLGKQRPDDPPHLVCLPERPLPAERLVAGIESVVRARGWCLVVLCENQPGPDGAVLGSAGEPRWRDAFGHAYYDSPAQHLATLVRIQLGVRARVDTPGTLQRMSVAHLSGVDLAEAETAGRAAVARAMAGASDVMITLLRESDEPYRCSTGTAPLAEIANHQRTLPPEFIGPDGWSLTGPFERYARPLLGGLLPEYARLES